MKLAAYTTLIRNMPVSAHAFTCSRKSWGPYIAGKGVFSNTLRDIFNGSSKITLARSDLRDLSKEPRLDRFAVSVILWGYPSGMRGKNIPKIRSNFEKLIKLLDDARAGRVVTWSGHRKRLDDIPGVGVSTYTKFLTFLDVHIDAHAAMILDNCIADVSTRQVFEEMSCIQELTYDRGMKLYPEYLRWIHSTAASLDVNAENLEFFLFEFGQNLKHKVTNSDSHPIAK